LEILQEDTKNIIGERKVENGLQIENLDEIMIAFEGNKLRPLKKVLTKEIKFDWKQNKCTLTSINVAEDIFWPEPETNQVHLQIAIANWNCKDDKFENQYSNEIILEKVNAIKHLDFRVEQLQSKELWIAYLFIGFSNKELRNTRPLHKKWNTTTIIGIQNFQSESQIQI
jgi:hypothetical protein